jgi:hypothetical protein
MGAGEGAARAAGGVRSPTWCRIWGGEFVAWGFGFGVQDV